MSEAPDLNLDEGRSQTFTLLGETFRLLRLSYRAFGERVTERERRRAEIAARRSANGDALMSTKPGATPIPSPPKPPSTAEIMAENVEVWDVQADFFESLIHPEDVDRFRALRGGEEGLMVRDIRALDEWIWEVYTGRPTQPAEDSTPGPGTTEASSRAESGSPEVIRSR